MTQKTLSIFVSKIGDTYVVRAGDKMHTFPDLGTASGYDSLLYFIKKHFDAKDMH